MEYLRLKDACEILDSLRVPVTASNREKGKYPYYGANGIQDYISDYIFDDELVLLAEDGGNFGSKEKPIAYRVSGKCWVNNHAHVLKPKQGLDVDYLCYSLMFYKVDGMVNGATRQKLTQTAMKEMKIPMRNMGKQLQIVDELNRTVNVKEHRKQQLKLLDELMKARFVEMFGDPVKNDKGWRTLPLEDSCKSIVDCPHSTPAYTTEYTGYMCIRTSIIKKNKIMWDEVEYISEEEFVKRIQRKKPEVGDVVYTREGAILGIAAIIDRKCNVALGQRLMLLSPDTNKCISEFLCVAMNCDSFLNNALKGVAGSASPHINVGDIKMFRMIMPPIELQNQFSDFVRAIDKSKVNYYYKNRKGGFPPLLFIYSVTTITNLPGC